MVAVAVEMMGVALVQMAAVAAAAAQVFFLREELVKGGLMAVMVMSQLLSTQETWFLHLIQGLIALEKPLNYMPQAAILMLGAAQMVLPQTCKTPQSPMREHLVPEHIPFRLQVLVV